MLSRATLFRPMNMMLFNTAKMNFSHYPRKAKTKKMVYTQLPDWLKKQERDPFDYKLRSLEEVKEEAKYFPPDFSWYVQTDKYPAGDVREHGNTRTDHRDKVAKITFDLTELGFSPEQRERFIFLLGPRYKPEHGNKCKIVQRSFLTWQENYIRALEQFREIYWEAKRAPDRNITMQRNPYRREYLTKKLLGKTKEQR